MKRLIFLIVIIAFIALIPIASFNTASAQCKSVVSKKASIDTDLPLFSGSYDPCDSWLKWTMSFTRTQEPNNSAGILIVVEGTTVYESFMDSEYSPGRHTETETIYVGPSESHELILDRTPNTNGHFEFIEGVVRYYASDPG